MHAREGKAKKICLGRRKKEGKKKRGGLRDKRRAVPLCPIEGPIVGELPHVFVLIAVRRRQKSCDSINEMTFVRPSAPRSSVLERQPQIPSLGPIRASASVHEGEQTWHLSFKEASTIWQCNL